MPRARLYVPTDAAPKEVGAASERTAGPVVGSDAMAPRERTHYQVLGVAPGASPEEIRRAHRQLARVLHPDRLGASSAAERSLAERRMREVNAAWTTLSDPALRRAYDRGLQAARTGPSATRPDPTSTRTTTSVDDDPDLEWARARAAEVDPDEPDLPPAQVWLLRRGPIVAAVLVAVLLFFVTAYAGTDAGDGGGGGTPSTSVAATDCVRRLDGRNAVQVACTADNDGRIVTYVDQPLDCPERTSYVVIDSRVTCVTNDPTLRSNLPSTTGA